MKISSPRRILAEDFEPDERDLVNKIADCFNTFAEDIFNVVNKNLTISENLAQELKTIQKVKVDATGKPIFTLNFKNPLKAKVLGMQVVRIIGEIPTSHPFITWVENNSIIEIKNITGLVNSVEYNIVIHLLS